MFDVLDAGSKQPKQPKQLSSKHVSTSGMMNQLTSHSAFTPLLILNLLHLNAKKKVKSNNKTLKDRETNPMNMIKTLECSAVKHPHAPDIT